MIVFMSCQSSNRDLPTISLNPLQTESVHLNQLMDSISYIPLETNDTCLVSNVRDIQYHKDKLYLFDDNLQKIFIFDIMGNCLSIIADRGNGPKEYISLSAFYINELKDQLVLIDNTQKKEMVYDLNGHFQYTQSIDYSIKSVSFLSNGTKLIVRQPVDAVLSTGYLLNISDNKGNNIKYFPFTYENGTPISSKDHDITVYGNTFYYNYLNNDTIFYFDEQGNFQPQMIVDFNGFGIPDRIKGLPQRERSHGIINYLRENEFKVASWFSIVAADMNNLLVSYSYNQTGYFAFYDYKTNGVTQSFSNPMIDKVPIFNLSDRYFCNQNTLMFVTSNYKILEDRDNYLDLIDSTNSLYQLVQGLTVESNPIIIMGHLHLQK